MAGLDLRKRPVVTPEKREAISAAKTEEIIDEVRSAMRKLGVPEIPQPSNAPPSLGTVNIENLDNRSLEVLYLQYVGFSEFLRPRLAELEASYAFAKAGMKRVVADLKNQARAAHTPKDEILASIQENPVYIEHDSEVLKLYAMREILKSYQSGFSNQAKAISRIIEIRKLEFEEGHRKNSIGGFRPDRPARPQPGLRRRV